MYTLLILLRPTRFVIYAWSHYGISVNISFKKLHIIYLQEVDHKFVELMDILLYGGIKLQAESKFRGRYSSAIQTETTVTS